jgi:hypothetical protein
MDSKYLYQVVTAQGHGEHGSPFSSLAQAKDAASRMRTTWPDVEVERVLELPGGGRRYWLHQDGRWMLWERAIKARRLREGT